MRKINTKELIEQARILAKYYCTERGLDEITNKILNEMADMLEQSIEDLSEQKNIYDNILQKLIGCNTCRFAFSKKYHCETCIALSNYQRAKRGDIDC